MNFTNLTKEEQLTILTNVAEDKGIVDNAIEKDYWVSMVLRAIFSLPYAAAFVFKGGTSLSKGWGLIERFSEDIDLAIDPQYLGFTNNAPSFDEIMERLSELQSRFRTLVWKNNR